MHKKLTRKDYSLSVLSGVLLALAFPLAELWILAWVGLVPVLFAIDQKRLQQSFGLGFLCGLVFFVGTLSWLFNITQWFSIIAAVGISLLLLYLSLYFGLFAIAYSFLEQRGGFQKLFIIPCAWVACEFVRAHLFSGFSWVSLGLSQYKVLPIIQIADITGVYGVSFLIVMVNVAVKDMIARSSPARGRTLLVTGLVVGVCFLHGQLAMVRKSFSSYKIAVVQANIPQDDKWNYALTKENLLKHIALTEEAVHREGPDLVIWPETSLPGIMDQNYQIPKEVKDLLAIKQTQLLAGIVAQEGEDYYNAAVLLSAEGDVDQVYRKVHLVPFGEFVPLRKWIPFLSALIPLEDFSKGDTYPLFSLRKKRTPGKINFSVLICFEDAVSSLARRFMKEGANLLVNITNDAWFGDSAAPFLHLQSSVFRAVENRCGVLRAANTGVSGYVNPNGKIQGLVYDERDKAVSVSGYAVFNVSRGKAKTVYTKLGDVFAYLCFGCILLSVSINRNINKREDR